MMMPARLVEPWALFTAEEQQALCAWTSAPHSCHDCGRLVARLTGYRFYADEGPQALCASCYQKRLMTAMGGRTHDLAAQVAG